MGPKICRRPGPPPPGRGPAPAARRAAAPPGGRARSSQNGDEDLSPPRKTLAVPGARTFLDVVRTEGELQGLLGEPGGGAGGEALARPARLRCPPLSRPRPSGGGAYGAAGVRRAGLRPASSPIPSTATAARL